jgi:AbrB family looped-hinge helix DNA binding protein
MPIRLTGMSKVTGKFQITLPKRLVESYDIKVGDHLELLPAGETISLVPARQVNDALPNTRQRLMAFDRATERQRKRERTRSFESAKDRGWTREELYRRGQSD